MVFLRRVIALLNLPCYWSWQKTRQCRGVLSINLIGALLAACAAPPIEFEKHVYSIPVPNTSLALEFPSSGFKLEVKDTNPPYYFFTNAKAKLNISFTLERATKCNSSETCRNYFANKTTASGASKKSWQPVRIGGIFASESAEEATDTPDSKRKFMLAHFVKEGMWINVRLSKTDYTESDREQFERLVLAIQFWSKL